MSHIGTPLASAMRSAMDSQAPSTHPPHPIRGEATLPAQAGPNAGPEPPASVPKGRTEAEHSLDELFSATRAYRRSGEFLRLLRFMRKFPQYSPYNCFLLHVQNPEVTLIAPLLDLGILGDRIGISLPLFNLLHQPV